MGNYGRFLRLIIPLNNYEKESGGFKSVRTHATDRRTHKTLGGQTVDRNLKSSHLSETACQLARKFAFGARVALNHSDPLRNRSQRNRSQRVPVLNWTGYIFWIIKIGAAGRARRGVTGRARRANSLGAKMKLSELAGRFSGFWKNQAGACWDHCSKTGLCI